MRLLLVLILRCFQKPNHDAAESSTAKPTTRTVAFLTVAKALLARQSLPPQTRYFSREPFAADDQVESDCR